MNDNGALKQFKTDTDEIRERIPVALWDKVSEDLTRDQCYSYWQYCLECIQQMADAWEEVNGVKILFGFPVIMKRRQNLRAKIPQLLKQLRNVSVII